MSKSAAQMGRDAAEIVRCIRREYGWNRKMVARALIDRGYELNDVVMRVTIKRVRAVQHERDLRGRWERDHLTLPLASRMWRLEWAREKQAQRALLALPIATHWRSDRRTKVAAAPGLESAESLAMDATIEAVTRLAVARWGFELRYTSKMGGRATSRYLTRDRSPDELGGFLDEVRISAHKIPVYGEREWRFSHSGPRWNGEVVVGLKELHWSLIRWRRELILRAAGRR